MTKLLYIARYRSASMRRKVELLATHHKFDVTFVYPSVWSDEFGTINQSESTGAVNSHHVCRPMPMFGRSNDPHRSTYRSLDFGLRQIKPDIIVAEEEPDSVAALHIAIARRIFASASKLVLYTWQNQPRKLGVIARTVMHLALAGSDAVMCANQEAVELLRKRAYSRPTPVIPAIGVDTRLFGPKAATRGNFTIGYVGRLDRAKGLASLVSACAALGDIDFRLHVVGDGPHREELIKDAKAAGVFNRLVLMASTPPEQLRDIYAQLSVLVLPSLTTPTWKEQFGRVLTEAMACGVPVIGSSSGAIPEVVGDAGLIFPENDVQALTVMLRQLASDPTLWEQLGQRGIARVQTHYTQDRIAAQTARFLQELIQS